MSPPLDYELLDFGNGRKLERFGAMVLDRPSPAAAGAVPERAPAWRTAHAKFARGEQGTEGWIEMRAALAPQWNIGWGELSFELRPTDFGHLGLFPEQAANWQWIAEQVRASAQPLKVLNLFAYTGGSTLAALAAGAEVVHIDAARNVVKWARRNAELSGLAERPARWIAEDAMKFVGRELRRGNAYQAVILDPPSYGHGAGGEAWKLAEHLPRLLAACAQLTAANRAFLLLSCHTPGYEAPELRRRLQQALGEGGRYEVGAMNLVTGSGRRLSSGHFARWTRA